MRTQVTVDYVSTLRPFTPAVPPGTPVTLAAELPPNLMQANSQLLAQFPNVARTLKAGTSEARPSTIVFSVVPGHHGNAGFLVHVPPSIEAQDPQFAEKLCFALQDAVKHGGVDTDRRYGQINTAALLLHHFGCDFRILLDLVKDDHSLHDLCSPFVSEEPVFQLYQHEGQINFAVVHIGYGDVAQSQMQRCLAVLDKAGRSTVGLALLAELIQTKSKYGVEAYGPYALCEMYVTRVLAGSDLANPAAATKAVETMVAAVDNLKKHFTGGPEAPFKLCGPLLVRLCSKESCHPALAWKLLQHLCPYGFVNKKDEECVALEALFQAAMREGAHEPAEGAINALLEMTVSSAEAAHQRCLSLLQEHEANRPLDEANPHRQTLRAAGFEFRFAWSSDKGRAQSAFVLYPTAMVREDPIETAVKTGQAPTALKTDEPPTKFVGAQHGRALVDFALSLMGPAARGGLACRYLVAVAEFLLQHHAALPQAAQAVVLGKLTNTVVQTICAQCQSARKLGPASTPSIGASLPMFVEAQTLGFAMFRVQELAEAGDEDGMDNLIRWVQQHKQQLFGHLPASILPHALQSAEGAEPDSSMVDEDNARVEMMPLSSRLIDLVAELVESDALSHAPDVAAALFGYWTAFTGSGELGYHKTRVQHVASATVQSRSPQAWATMKSVAEHARQALLDSAARGNAGSPAAVDLFGSLIDLVAGAENAPTNEVSAWAIQFHEDLGRDQELLGSLSQIEPNATIWPQLGSTALLLGKNQFATVHGILVASALTHGAMWDARLSVAFETTLKHCLAKGLHAEAIGLFMIRKDCIDQSVAAPQPQSQRLDVWTLLSLISVIRDSLVERTYPGVSRDDALCALLVELLVQAPELAAARLDAVLSSTVGTSTVASEHPTLASRVHLEFAKHFFAQGDRAAMLRAFSDAMANVPDDEDARVEVKLLCEEFMASVQSGKGGDDDWRGAIQQMGAHHKV